MVFERFELCAKTAQSLGENPLEFRDVNQDSMEDTMDKKSSTMFVFPFIAAICKAVSLVSLLPTVETVPNKFFSPPKAMTSRTISTESDNVAAYTYVLYTPSAAAKDRAFSNI